MTVEILLTQDRVALIDDADLPLVGAMRWFYAGGYAARRVGKVSNSLMHRELLGAEIGLEVDHINGNTLDNRRANLRLCTGQQNAFNRKKVANTSSCYKGVSWDCNKWRAYIHGTRISHRINLGRFSNEIDAAHAYDAAAKELYGEFARTNF